MLVGRRAGITYQWQLSVVYGLVLLVLERCKVSCAVATERTTLPPSPRQVPLLCMSLLLAPCLSRPGLTFNATSPPFTAMDFVWIRYNSTFYCSLFLETVLYHFRICFSSLIGLMPFILTRPVLLRVSFPFHCVLCSLVSSLFV